MLDDGGGGGAIVEFLKRTAVVSFETNAPLIVLVRATTTACLV